MLSIVKHEKSNETLVPGVLKIYTERLFFKKNHVRT